MHIFSLSPTFAIEDIEDNLDSKNIVEAPILSDDKVEQAIKENIETNSIEEETPSVYKGKDNYIKHNEETEDAVLYEDNSQNATEKENISNGLTTNNGSLNNEIYLSDDSCLSSLAFYGGNVIFTEKFNPDVKNYTCTIVGNGVSVRSYPAGYNVIKARNAKATIDVYFNNDLILSDVNIVPDYTFKMVEGIDNIMKIVVTAENGDKSIYTIDFKREGFSDSKLGRLAFYGGTVKLTEEFNPNIYNYIGVLSGNGTSVRTYPAGYNVVSVRDPYAKMAVYFNNELIFNDVKTIPDYTFKIVEGIDNIMKIVVISEGRNKSEYTIKFEREGFNDTKLDRLAFYSNNVTLKEEFNTNVYNYIGVISGNGTSVRTYPAGYNVVSVRDPYAKMAVYFNNELIFNDVKTIPDYTFKMIRGINNIMKIVVTAQNGDQSTYTVHFEREFDSNTSIKDFSINKCSLELVDDTYIATMNSWQGISLSNLVLEDSWANYRVLLNDKKEIALNEKFDLDIGDNKLDIEVTSNNGTKKNYPVIFERSDTANPSVNYTVGNRDWINEDILISIESSDDSGIRYIELPNGEKVYSNKAEFYANQNGTYKFKVYDNFLNETVETVEIKNIDKELPKLELKPSTTDLTNESVDIIINTSDNVGIKQIETPDGQIITKSTLTYTVYEDGTYTFKTTDLAGNEVVKSITLNNIDSVNPVLATELSNNDWSNEEITLSVFAMSDKGIKYIELPDGTKVENNFAEYEIKENGTYFIATESLGGNITSEKVVINNIDTELPTLSLSSSIEDWTNEDVDIIINAEDNIGIDYIVLPDGQTIFDSKYTYSVESNGTYEFAVVDLAGNKTTESIEIKNIDKNPPVIENYDKLASISNNIITIDLSEIETPSGIHKVILPNKEEVIEPEGDIIEYEVVYNDIYTFTVVDRAGNSVDVDFKVDTLIDKENDTLVNKIDSIVDSLPNTGGIYSVVLCTSIGLILGGVVILIRIRKK